MGKLFGNFMSSTDEQAGDVSNLATDDTNDMAEKFGDTSNLAMNKTIDTMNISVMQLSHDNEVPVNEDGSLNWDNNQNNNQNGNQNNNQNGNQNNNQNNNQNGFSGYPDNDFGHQDLGYEDHIFDPDDFKPHSDGDTKDGPEDWILPNILFDPDDFKPHLGVDTENGPKGVTLDVYKPIEVNGRVEDVVGLLDKNGDFHSYDAVMQAAAKQSFAEHFSKIDLPDEIADKLFSTEFESTNDGVHYTNYDAFMNHMGGTSYIGGFNAGLDDVSIDRYDQLYPGFKDAYNATCSDLALCDNYLHQTADERAAVPRVIKSDIIELISDSVNDLSKNKDYDIGIGHDHSDMNPVIINEFNPVATGVSSAVEGISTGKYIDKDGQFDMSDFTLDIIAGSAFGAILSTSDTDISDKKELLNTLLNDKDLMSTVLDGMSDPMIRTSVSEAMGRYGLDSYIDDIKSNVMNPQAIMDIVHDPEFLESLSETVNYICESPIVEDYIDRCCKDSDLKKSIDNVVDDFSQAESLISGCGSISDEPDIILYDSIENHTQPTGLMTHMSHDVEENNEHSFFDMQDDTVCFEL